MRARLYISKENLKYNIDYVKKKIKHRKIIAMVKANAYGIGDVIISKELNKLGVNKPNLLEKVFCKSKMLSADVDACFDPIYANVSDRINAGYLGRGISLNKYTGARGKSGASDANAEFVAEVRNIFENNDIQYQLSELGKVDVGGGGTIAYILANKGIEVIDCGVPVLSMHSPYEVTSKLDRKSVV